MQKMNPLRLSLFERFSSYLVVALTAKVGIKLLLFCFSVTGLFCGFSVVLLCWDYVGVPAAHCGCA